MSNIDYIINLCQTIHSGGKTPSVALIRNRATCPVSIPEVIKALQYWKANPNQLVPDKKTKIDKQSEQTTSLEQRICSLEDKLEEIMQELARLTANRDD